MGADTAGQRSESERLWLTQSYVGISTKAVPPGLGLHAEEEWEMVRARGDACLQVSSLPGAAGITPM